MCALQSAALVQRQGLWWQSVVRAGTWLALSTPPKMLITLAGMAAMKPYLPLPSALVRNCALQWQHDQRIFIHKQARAAMHALQAPLTRQAWHRHSARVIETRGNISCCQDGGMWYRKLGSADAQQLRRQLPHRGHVEGRRAALDLCWLDLFLLPGCAVRSEHCLDVIHLERPASWKQVSRSRHTPHTVLHREQQRAQTSDRQWPMLRRAANLWEGLVLRLNAHA